jgi:hypothetical protein
MTSSLVHPQRPLSPEGLPLIHYAAVSGDLHIAICDNPSMEHEAVGPMFAAMALGAVIGGAYLCTVGAPLLAVAGFGAVGLAWKGSQPAPASHMRRPLNLPLSATYALSAAGAVNVQSVTVLPEPSFAAELPEPSFAADPPEPSFAVELPEPPLAVIAEPPAPVATPEPVAAELPTLAPRSIPTPVVAVPEEDDLDFAGLLGVVPYSEPDSELVQIQNAIDAVAGPVYVGSAVSSAIADEAIADSDVSVVFGGLDTPSVYAGYLVPVFDLDPATFGGYLDEMFSQGHAARTVIDLSAFAVQQPGEALGNALANFLRRMQTAGYSVILRAGTLEPSRFAGNLKEWLDTSGLRLVMVVSDAAAVPPFAATKKVASCQVVMVAPPRRTAAVKASFLARPAPVAPVAPVAEVVAVAEVVTAPVAVALEDVWAAIELTSARSPSW